MAESKDSSVWVHRRQDHGGDREADCTGPIRECREKWADPEIAPKETLFAGSIHRTHGECKGPGWPHTAYGVSYAGTSIARLAPPRSRHRGCSDRVGAVRLFKAR